MKNLNWNNIFTYALLVAILLLVIPSGCFLTRQDTPTPQPTPPQAAPPGRYNYRVRDSSAYSTLDIATLLPNAETPRHLFENVYSIQGVGLTQDMVIQALGDHREWIEPDYAIALDKPIYKDYGEGLELFATPNDALLGQQYSIGKMGLTAAWDVSKGDGVIIAIVDTGVDCSGHPDLAGKCVPGRSFVDGITSTDDDNGHGSHVAGIAAASTNNATGIAGIGYNARIMPLKAMSANGGGQYSWITAAIAYAADNGAKVINLSLGGSASSETMQAALKYAVSRGALPICAAGNGGNEIPNYPAFYDDCLSVAATNSSDQRASFSTYGPGVDIAAPGDGILSTVRGGQYQAWSGTSMATPNISGLAALVRARNPSYSARQIRDVITNTADAIGPGVGAGRANAGRAVGGLAPAPGPGPQPQPTATPPQPQQPPPTGWGDWHIQITDLINKARQQNGLPALRYDSRLQAAADFHNRWMLNTGCFNHNCPGEPDVAQRMRDAGYPVNGGGENIGKGYTSPQHMMDGWMNSSGHRAAILNTYWPDIGCGYLRGPSGQNWDSYWSCEFAAGGGGQPQPTQPPFQPPPTPTLFKPPATATPWWQPPPPPATATRPVVGPPPLPTSPPPGAGFTCPPGYRCAFIAPGPMGWRGDLGWSNLCYSGEAKVKCLP